MTLQLCTVVLSRAPPKRQQSRLQAMEDITVQQETPSTSSLPSEFAAMSTSRMTNQTLTSYYSDGSGDSTLLSSTDLVQEDFHACLADQRSSQQQMSGSNATTSVLETQKKQSHRFTTKAEKEAHRRSTETQAAHDLRLAAVVERAALRKSNETENERKLRLAVNAERARLRRLAENEESRADRLARDAERTRERRAAAAIEKRVLRSHTRVDTMQAQPAAASRANIAQKSRKRPRSQQSGEEDCVPSTSILDNFELVENVSCATSSCLSSNISIEEMADENELTSFERSEQESTSTILNQRPLSQIEESNSTNNEQTQISQIYDFFIQSNFVRIPAIASNVLSEDLTTQVPRALEVNLNDVNENSLNFTIHRSPVHREHEDCEVILLPSKISSTTYGTVYPPPRTATSESLNTASEQPAIQMRSPRGNEQHRRRSPPNFGIALTENNVDENYLGVLSVSCNHCAALYFPGEAKPRNGCFNMCCNFGNISLDLFSNFPELLLSLYTGTSDLSKNFRTHIRSYNSALAMASMGAQVDTPRGFGPYCYRIHGQVYHYVGPARPEKGLRPQFGQIYILDTDAAAAERMGNPANANCNATVMQQLTSWLHSNNSYAASFKMMGDVAAEEEQRALIEKRQIPTIRMVFDDSDSLDRRRYNVPASSEIAVVYVGEDNDVPASRSLAIHYRRGGLQKIRDIDGCCDPLTYPLIFPRGGQGWHVDLKKNPSTRIRTRLTQREFYSNLLAVRRSFNPLHFAGKLMQQFVVDAYVKIEQNRLNYARTHQTELRVDSYKGLMDHLARDDTDGPPGQRIILPSSFQGSPRAMHQAYQDAMAIVAKYGKPDYFLTFTCNPKWKEITENLHPGQSSSDRPDLVTRVFNRKLEVLQNHLFEKKVLGRVAAYVGIVEWQKRGLPHCHMLLIMAADSKPRTSENVDAAVQAFLPSATDSPRLLSIVARNMIHRRCGRTNLNAPCMLNGECSKRFPKEFRDTTDVDVNGYPNYKRPDDGTTVTIRDETFDNRHVVPYNRYLLLLLNAHINLEICGYVQAVKYLYKYVYKGPDRAALRLLQQDPIRHSDEIRAHLDARYVCSPEALHHIFMFGCQFKSATVYRLPVHLPDFQLVTFQSGGEREAAEREVSKDSMLTAWFKLNIEYELMENQNIICDGVDARNLCYHQLPEHFTFVNARKWKRRGRGSRQIGRMYMVSPAEPERFALRILLLHRKNMHSFEDLRTVEGNVHSTFLDAARALGFLRDDSHYESCLEEATQFQMPAQLRALFSYMLAFCEISNPRHLYDRFKADMAEDFSYGGATASDAEALAYYDLYDRLQILRYDLPVSITPPTHIRPVLQDQTDYASHEEKGREMYQCLNRQQKSTADSILASFDSDAPKLHFVDGPGGSGKTYLYNCLYHMLKGKHKSIICVAWTGIAANLLPEGRTASSTFKLNMRSGNRECTLRRESKEATPLKEADIIIWDEISMVSKLSLKAIDRLFQDLMCNTEHFGGKTVVLGGDFRQVLPIVERGRDADMVDACVKNSDLWELFRMHQLSVNMRSAESGSFWCDFLMRVGNGEAEEDEGGRIEIPAEIVSNGNLIDDVFGDLLTDFHTLSERAILAPRNIDVHEINEEVLDKLPGQLHEYYSVDDVISDEPQNDFTSEFLNSLTPTGMAPHKLRLKEGAIVMLLRNLDVRNGLCNGTRLIVTHFKRFVLGCRFASGDRKGNWALIPRIDNYTDKGVPFRLRRTQFPVRLSFAMTINKAQGQSFTKVGISLGTEVFSHGQLYVALSRCRSKEGVKVYKKEERVRNVVIKAVLN